MNSHSRKINTSIRPMTEKYTFSERSVAGGYLLLAALVVVAVIVARWIVVLS